MWWFQRKPPQLFHHEPNTALRYIYLSCFRGSVFRLNIGLAVGEERGLMEDRKENAQQTHTHTHREKEKGFLEDKVEILQNSTTGDVMS